MCVLDQDGQFLYDIDSAVTPNLTDIISFDSEGVSWTIPGSLTFGPDDDLRRKQHSQNRLCLSGT